MLGDSTEEVLAEVTGLPSGAIGRLFDEGVVAGPRVRGLPHHRAGRLSAVPRAAGKSAAARRSIKA